MGPTMGKYLGKLMQPVLAVPSMPVRKLKSYDADIIMFSETNKLVNQDICEFNESNQHSYNLYKQHFDEAMIQKLTKIPDWETAEEDMDRVGLVKMLRQHEEMT